MRPSTAGVEPSIGTVKAFVTRTQGSIATSKPFMIVMKPSFPGTKAFVPRGERSLPSIEGFTVAIEAFVPSGKASLRYCAASRMQWWASLFVLGLPWFDGGPSYAQQEASIPVTEASSVAAETFDAEVIPSAVAPYDLARDVGRRALATKTAAPEMKRIVRVGDVLVAAGPASGDLMDRAIAGLKRTVAAYYAGPFDQDA